MTVEIDSAWNKAVEAIVEFEKAVRRSSPAHAYEVRLGWDTVREAYEDFNKLTKPDKL